MKTKLDNFINRITIQDLQCPICHTNLSKIGTSLVCDKKHTFNINKKGYLNLEPQKQLKHYNETLFLARHSIIISGYFDDLINKIDFLLKKYDLKEKLVVDVGCGEGSFLNKLNLQYSYGLDLSSDAIKVASKYYVNNSFIVADLANIPLQDNKVGCLLNILSPANYDEFSRVLENDGYLIKVIPNKNYLKEFKLLLDNDIMESNLVITNLEKHYKIIEEINVEYKINVSKTHQADFIRMTPLMINIPNNKIKYIQDNFPKKLSIDLKILIAKTNK